ncbi:MAG TPA: hypothetical protein VG818_07180, partial [Gemmatimonadaceae bacterium]|nr:hypothetical protein [Gemmatimonadaceae bacterium]
MFESLRQSLNDLLARATKPEDRRDVLARMKDTLVRARMGVDDLRAGLQKARAQVDAERRELETVQRRKALAEGIQDAETIAVATRFEQHHAERVAVLAQKVEVQERELAMAERELEEMTAEFKRHAIGAVPPPSTAGRMADPLADETGESALDAIDALARERQR